MSAIWTIGAGNPKRKRKAGKRKSKRSPAQKAATKRMLAGLRRKQGGFVGSGKPSRKRRSKRRGSVVARVSRRRARRAMTHISGMGRGLVGSAMSLAKAGAVGAGGAIAVDFLMAQAGRVLPASVMSKIDANGTVNFSYYGAKGALAVLLGTFGRKLPVVGKYASDMAAGSLVTMMYELGRAAMPATAAAQLGYYNAAPMVGAYVGRRGNAQVGAYVEKVASIRTVGQGAPGARVQSMMQRARG